MKIEHDALEELKEALERHGVSYLIIGKGGAILHGFPDTTQDTDLYVKKERKNAQALTRALRETGFDIAEKEAEEIESGKDFIQLRNGPFDVDLVFAPDGIENFEGAWARGVRIGGFPVCALQDIIESKRSANRSKDRETLPRLEDFARYIREKGTTRGEPLPKPGGMKKHARTSRSES